MDVKLAYSFGIRLGFLLLTTVVGREGEIIVLDVVGGKTSSAVVTKLIRK